MKVEWIQLHQQIMPSRTESGAPGERVDRPKDPGQEERRQRYPQAKKPLKDRVIQERSDESEKDSVVPPRDPERGTGIDITV